MGKKAIVAGHICIDITPVFPKNTHSVKDLGEIFKPGKLIHMSSADVHTGGAVANTGLGMKILGADVRLMGKIGDDAFGGMIQNILKEYHADDDLLVSKGEITSYSVVVAAPGVDRIFLHCPGANDTFDGTEIEDAMLADVALFHFGYPPIMKKMYEDGGDHLLALFRKMKEKHIATSLDMAAIDPDSPAGKADWEGILKKVLPYVDFFVPSFEELCFMLDRSLYESLLKRAGNGDITGLLSVEKEIAPLADRCLSLGAKSVLLKCGAPGLYFKASEDMADVGSRLGLQEAQWNGYCRFEKSYRIPAVISGTGAGDTSIAAFLTSLLEGETPRNALENAAAAGALCCTAYDATSGLKPLEKIREMIDSGWEKADQTEE
ncbi:MAG: carbohydrate kinase family protein [Lachnospiraceae bacterium]|nr:carbohydrate kinase family protein [Lachnospiraceae bacterium]